MLKFQYEEVPRECIDRAVLQAVERARGFCRKDLGIDPPIRYFREYGYCQPRRYFGETFEHELRLRGCYNSKTGVVWLSVELSPQEAGEVYSHEARHCYQRKGGLVGIDEEADAERYKAEAKKAYAAFPNDPWRATKLTNKALLPRTDGAMLRWLDARAEALRPQTHNRPVEKRCFGCEVRADDSTGLKIKGYAAVFDKLSEDLGGYKERIIPGAFKNALKADVRLLLNHDPNIILARTKSKTLTLREDSKGLYFEGELADTAAAKDVYTSIKRGDIDQMSFGFKVVKDRWLNGNPQIRELVEVKLFDVSVVAFPAYSQTQVEAASAFGRRDLAIDLNQLKTAVYRRQINHRATRERDRQTIRQAIAALESIKARATAHQGGDT